MHEMTNEQTYWRNDKDRDLQQNHTKHCSIQFNNLLEIQFFSLSLSKFSSSISQPSIFAFNSLFHWIPLSLSICFLSLCFFVGRQFYHTHITWQDQYYIISYIYWTRNREETNINLFVWRMENERFKKAKKRKKMHFHVLQCPSFVFWDPAI